MIQIGVLKNFDSGTYKAGVQLAGSLTTYFDDINVAKNIPSSAMVIGNYVILAIPGGNPRDACVIATWPQGTAGGGGVSSGSVFPTSPTKGELFLHTPTGRNILYEYDGSAWIPIISLGAMTVYVDSAGTDDLNHGTGPGTDAFKTVPYAINCIPGSVGGNVDIYPAAGTFPDDITIQGKYFTGSYSINIRGADFSKVALTINSATQGSNGTTNYGTITQNGATWGLRATLESGTTDGWGAGYLYDAGQNFLTTCRVGMSVKNTTDNTWAHITAVNSDILLTLDADIMRTGENYIIGWPEHKGKWITFSPTTFTVALQGGIYLILDNTSDMLTIVGKFAALPVGADTAYISSLTTSISGAITTVAGQLGVNFYRIDLDAPVYQIASQAFSVSAFYYCDIKGAGVAGCLKFVGCFIHKEDDVKCTNRIIFANSKFTQCFLTSCILDGEGHHYGGATPVRGADVNNGAEFSLFTPPSVIQNFTPKAGVTNYGVYLRVNNYFAAWRGADCNHWIRFCSVGLDAALGAIGQYALPPYVTYQNNGVNTNVDAATFAVVQ